MKIRFINYFNKFPHAQCYKSYKPSIQRLWNGKLIYFNWKQYSICLDIRKNWMVDMMGIKN